MNDKNQEYTFRLGQRPWDKEGEPWTVFAVEGGTLYDLNKRDQCSNGLELAALIETLRTEKSFSDDDVVNDAYAKMLTYAATHGEYLSPGKIAAEQPLAAQLDAERSHRGVRPHVGWMTTVGEQS